MHDDIYELHVAESGRWHLQERFRGTQKDEAVEEAKRHFASPSVEAVRVILEKYDEGEQLFKQRTIYRQSKQKVAPPTTPPVQAAPRRVAAAAPMGRGGAVPRTAQARPLASAASVLASPATASAKPKTGEEALPERSLASRLVLSALIAVALSGIGVLLLTGVLGGENGPLAHIDPIVIYLLALIVFALAFWISLKVFGRTAGRRRPPQADGPDTLADDTAAASAEPVPAHSEPPPGEGAEKTATAADKARAEAEQKAIEERGLAAILGQQVPHEDGGTPDATTAAPDPAAPPPNAAAEKPAEEKLDSATQTANRDYLLTFLRDSLVHPATQAFTAAGLDGRNRFACHLYILGAAEAILAKTKAGPQELPIIIGPALEALGTGADRAGMFLSRIADYQRDAKFSAAIDAGRAAMAARLQAGSGGAEKLGPALEAWNGVNEAAQKTLDIAILFTDMVASVATTQRLGEEQAMRLVQTHNSIVAVALKRHRGHQVKHTGDGIMAVFPRVADGLAAAVDIQRQCAEHNNVTPGEQILLRVGLSAGQPVQENNDYFGTIVQLSARLSSLGEPGDIHCDATFADYVKDNPVAPLSAPFDVPLKGFAQQQTVYRVDWQNDTPVAEASE